MNWEPRATFRHIAHPAPVPAHERVAKLADPGFGRVFTDHMVTVRWSEGQGWHDAEIRAREPFQIDPASAVLHYAQEIFEGLKAYRAGNGVVLFRPERNALRFQQSAERLAMPALPEPPKPGLPADWQAIEAPFIVHHGDYYYLFVSFDLCCRGTKSSYRTMVGRSTQVTGSYVDAEGKPMLQGGGTQLLGPNSRWLGPGGESVLQRPEGDILVFHAYDAITGKPALQISTLTWDNGWPHAALGTVGESR